MHLVGLHARCGTDCMQQKRASKRYVAFALRVAERTHDDDAGIGRRVAGRYAELHRVAIVDKAARRGDARD